MRYTNLTSNRPEGDAVRWYWRAIAICASCLILGGFLVVPSTFDTAAQLRVSKAAIGIFGIALLTAGFSLTALVCFGSRSWAFSVEHVFFPAAVVCTIGFLNVPYCFIVSTRFKWNTPALVTTIGSVAATAIYAALYFFARRRLNSSQHGSERIDLLRRPSITSTTPSYHTQNYFANHFANMYPTARAPAPSIVATTPEEDPLNEDELQRRHMSALLHKPEPYISPAASPFNRIEFNVDETDSPINGYYAPTAAASSSRPLEEPSWRGRNSSWVTNDSRRTSTSREERRREIEMGGR